MGSSDSRIPLTETDLPARTRNALEEWLGVTTVAQLRRLGDKEILRTPQISTKGLAHIKALLED